MPDASNSLQCFLPSSRLNILTPQFVSNTNSKLRTWATSKGANLDAFGISKGAKKKQNGSIHEMDGSIRNSEKSKVLCKKVSEFISGWNFSGLKNDVPFGSVWGCFSQEPKDLRKTPTLIQNTESASVIYTHSHPQPPHTILKATKSTNSPRAMQENINIIRKYYTITKGQKDDVESQLVRDPARQVQSIPKLFHQSKRQLIPLMHILTSVHLYYTYSNGTYQFFVGNTSSNCPFSVAMSYFTGVWGPIGFHDSKISKTVGESLTTLWHCHGPNLGTLNSWKPLLKAPVLRLMEEIPNNHLTCMKPCKKWNIYHINWCRISSINSSWWFFTNPFEKYIWSSNWIMQSCKPQGFGVKIPKIYELPPPRVQSNWVFRVPWRMPLGSLKNDGKDSSHLIVVWHTVDGRNPANQLIGSLSHYFQGFIHPRWCMVVQDFFHQQYG